MKKLLILRGIQGSGKSSFIKENKLENFTLSSDKIRILSSGFSYSSDYNKNINNNDNMFVWKTLYSILENRMKNDLFTVVDATHYNNEMLKEYISLGEKYDYELYICDFEVSLEEALNRNKTRPKEEFVPEQIITKFHEKLQNSRKNKIKAFHLVSKENWKSELLKSNILNLDYYENVWFIGDLQGTFQPINDFFKDHRYSEKDLYIFLGDYVDRGLENHLAVQFCLDHMNKRNMIFCKGNHEYHLENWAKEKEIKSKEFIEKTMVQLEQNEISKEKVKEFCSKLKEFVIIRNSDKEFLASHSGFGYFPNDNDFFEISGSEFINKKDYKFCVDSFFESNTKNNQYQFHGHRNPEKKENNEQSRSFSLEDNVEFNGHLRIVKYSKNKGFDFLKIKNVVIK